MEGNINKSTAEALNMGEPYDLSDFGKKLHEHCRLFYFPIYLRHERAYQFYLGDQWRVYRRSGLAMPVFNIVGPHMDIIASNLTDSSITFQTAPKNPEDAKMTKIHNEVLRIACEQDSLPVRLYGHLIDSLVKGYSVGKVTHDPKRLVPTHIDFVDPYNYMGEPGVRRPDIDGTYHWHSEWMTAMQIREIYPEKWREIKYTDTAGSDYGSQMEFVTEREGDYNYTYMARIHELYIRTNETERIPKDVTLLETQGEREEIERAKAPRVVLEQDHKAHTEAHQAQYEEIVQQLNQAAMQAVTEGRLPPEQVEQAVAEAVEKNPILILILKHAEEHALYAVDNPKGEREKYNGWMRIVYGGDDFVVLEGPVETPYTDEEGRGIHPFCIMTTPETGTDIYQWSILERCMQLQEMLNLWLGKFQDHLSLCACPMLALDVDRVEIDPNQITALAGSVIPVNGDPREVMYWVQPPQIAGQLIQNTYQMMKQIELITGVSDVELGAYPNMERASEPMIRQLKEAGRARWREYQRELRDFLTRMGHKLMMVIQANMTEQAQLRIGATQDAFVVVNQKQEGKATRLNDMTVGAFDVRIELQPLESLTPDAKLQRALALFSTANPQGFAPYDLQAVAEESEDPIMAESVQRQMQMMQQMMQAKQQEEQTRGAG
jgi:hypothetical protein